MGGGGKPGGTGGEKLFFCVLCCVCWDELPLLREEEPDELPEERVFEELLLVEGLEYVFFGV